MKNVFVHNQSQFIKVFEKAFPLNLHSGLNYRIDKNLTCFLKINQILSEIKVNALIKSYLNWIIDDHENESLNKQLKDCINTKYDKLKEYNTNADSTINYEISFSELKKIKFSANLYNIQNYILFNIDNINDIASLNQARVSYKYNLEIGIIS